MSFYTQKRRDKKISLIFRALKKTKCSFNGGSVLNLLLMLVLNLSLISSNIPIAYASDLTPNKTIGTTKTINVYPSRIAASEWEGNEFVLSPDLSDEAIYQDFSRRTAAYLNHDSLLPADIESMSDIEPPSLNDVDNKPDPTEIPVLEVDPAREVDPETQTNVPESIVPVLIEEELEIIPASEPEVVSQLYRLEKRLTHPVITDKREYEFLLETTEINDVVSVAEKPNEAEVKPEVETPVEPASVVMEADLNIDPQIDMAEADLEPAVVDPAEISPDEVYVTESNDEAKDNLSQSNYVVKSISLSDFSTLPLEPGQFIRNIQLRASLAGRATADTEGDFPSLEFSVKTASSTENIGSILLDGEVSNALNGGNYLFAFPTFTDIADLEAIAVTVSYEGFDNLLDAVYLDALWLEIEIESIDKTLLEEKTQTDINDILANPEFNTLISDQVEFTQAELPRFSLRYNSQRNVAVRFLRELAGKDLAAVADVSFVHEDVGDIGVLPKIHMTSDGLMTIQIEETDRSRMRPGEYTVVLSIDEGGETFTDSFSFQWGMLAINSHKTSYVPGEIAQISMGALSPNGNTVCDAALLLYIIDPNNNVVMSPVTPSDECNGNNVVAVPDYTATFVPQIIGEYEMYLERVDTEGNIVSHTSGTFLVDDVLPLSIERSGPSRIYPKVTYPMVLTVHATEAWSGTLVEVVPADFVITDTEALTRVVSNTIELSFEVNMAAGDSQTFSYTFDAPDISPFLYSLGAARLEGVTPKALLERTAKTLEVTTGVDGLIPETPVELVPEPASTTPATSLPNPGSATTEPEAVSPPDAVSSSQEVVVPEAVVVVTPEASSLLTEPEVLPNNDTGVTVLEPPVAVPKEDPVLLEVTPAVEVPIIPDDIPFVEPVAAEPISFSPTSEAYEFLLASGEIPAALATTSVTNNLIMEPVPAIAPEKPNIAFAEHRQWQIASDAVGSMIVYWTDAGSIPLGWTCLSCGSGMFYQKFVRGGATYTTGGGAATHTHTASGAINASVTANTENRAGTTVSNTAHAHTFTPSITASSSLPAYRNLRVIQNNSAGEPASLPAGVVLLFDGTLPSGWTRYTALDDRYPRGETTIANAGTSTHRHTIGGTTDAASGSTLGNRVGGVQVAGAASSHTHTVNSNTGYVNHEPPFISVIFATSSIATSTPTGAITMWTDTPPAQWQHQSAQTGDVFFDNFIKGSATFGTTGGALSHTHANVIGITSSAASPTQNARTGSVGSSGAHTHLVDVADFTTADNLPPYVTAIFGRKFGAIPLYTQMKYRFYVNSDVNTPTDAWPVGGSDLLENEPIDSSIPVADTNVIRLRLQLSVSNSTSTSEVFKLQYASTTALCSDASLWTDVGSATSSVAWRGYNNASVIDGVTLASTTLSSTTVAGSYEEQNPSVVMPNTVGIDQSGEWDFVLQSYAASAGTTYCFRMVESDGSQLYTYTEYPTLVTNQSPMAPTLSKLFDNEKVATTTPSFEFYTQDPEANDVSYQIQIDDNYDFASTITDKDSETFFSLFTNLATPSDKDPFVQGQTIRFDGTPTLTNGTTYYWRVRAKDPNGSNEWGSWATPYSFTVDTSVTLSTWFQTRQEQFSANILDGVEGVAHQAQLVTGSTTGTMYSNPIIFSDGTVGTAWGSFSFTDIETTSDLKYTIQYNDSDVWTDIPDSILPGNVTGFDTSPVSLLGVDKTNYTELRIEANFTNAGASPSLQDWAITWGYLIDTPTIVAPFANEKVSTTTPTFTFTTTDPQSDALEYQIQWSNTYDFVASTTRISGSDAGFTNTDDALDTTPFTSGDTIQFKLQSADALTNGNTYWWRVRARDPLGSNTYSFFTEPRSFTVDTTVVVSTWFQTTQSQFDIDTLTNVTTQVSGAATVSTTTDDSLIAYAEGVITTPRYRLWNGTTWGIEGNALDVGAAINWVVTKPSPFGTEHLLVTLGTDADVNAQVYKNGAWGDLQELTTTIPNTAMRGFDVTYEQVSGDAMVVTCDGDADPSYYTWNGTSWTNGGAIGLTGGNTCGWIKLIADPTSDEIIAITRDTSGITYEARVWSGSAWGNSATWGSMNQVNHEGIAAEYEESGGQAVVVVSNGTASRFSWRSWDGTNWTAAANVTLGDDFEAGSLVRDDGSDNMVLCYVDQDGDIGASRWTGAAWTTFTELETAWTTADLVYNDRPIDCAFEVGGARDGYIMAVYSDTTNLRYRVWTGAAWDAEASVSTVQDGRRVQGLHEEGRRVR